MSPRLSRLPELIRTFQRDQWLLVVLGLLIAMFLAVLFTESTSVGRGGR